MNVDFYHLTAAPIERILPQIAEKVIGGGGRLLVVTADPAQATVLDRVLWNYSPDSFLPHAVMGAGNDAAQPVLIATEVEPANAARNVALVDGLWRDEALTFDRAFHIFDDEAIREARLAWKALADRDDVQRRYWKQTEGGRWEQAA